MDNSSYRLINRYDMKATEMSLQQQPANKMSHKKKGAPKELPGKHKFSCRGNKKDMFLQHT